jgi:hypothetical protein
MPKLICRALVIETRAHYREHDPERSRAHETALDGIRDGTGRSRAIRSGEVPGYLTRVVVPGRVDDDVIVWELDDQGRAVILYLGPLV